MKFSVLVKSLAFITMFVGSVLSSVVSVSAFTVTVSTTPTSRTTTGSCSNGNASSRYMFSGAGLGLPNEDNPDEIAKLEQAAKSMGMTVAEYKLGISARLRLSNELDTARVSAGKTNLVTIVRDGNNPPKHLEITITEDGKALGTKELSNELVKALKMASELSRNKRSEAQRNMMSYIGDEMKKIGS